MIVLKNSSIVVGDDHHTFALHWLIDSLQSGFTAFSIVTGAEPRVYYVLSREAQVKWDLPEIAIHSRTELPSAYDRREARPVVSVSTPWLMSV